MRSNTTSPASSRPARNAPSERSAFSGQDDIVAVATPPGRGGISIARLSGCGIPALCRALTGTLPAPRHASLCDFRDGDGTAIDRGLALYFPAPDSYTGEHTLELHGHGSPVVMQMLLRRCLELGAVLARPGEFSERAFRNGRLDLAQAEAVADLIASGTESAARSAMRSLQGEFSTRVHEIVGELTQLRMFIESAIDFPEEEIDFLADENIAAGLHRLQRRFARLGDSAHRGKLLRDGLKVVLTGPPNAGKSSLLNALSQQQRAIVSAIPGTTRDVLEQFIEIDGLPVELIDTAGIRESADEIEVEGVRRARAAQRQAGLILLVIDDADTAEGEVERLLARTVADADSGVPLCLVRNKIDVSGRSTGVAGAGAAADGEVALSALRGDGLAELRELIKRHAGFRDGECDGFIARQRHVDALRRAARCLDAGIEQFSASRAGELLAEELGACQRILGEITGEVDSDELLGMIFASFCIGK